MFQVRPENGGAGIGRRPVGGLTGAMRGDDAGHHISGGFQARAFDGLICNAGDARQGFGVNPQGIGGGQRARLIKQTHAMQKWIVGFFRLNLGLRQICRRHISPGVAIKADGGQVQKHRLAAGAGKMRGLFDDSVGVVNIQTIGAKILKAGAVLETCRDPAFGRLGGNADAVVFAYKQQRQRDCLIRGPASGVEGPLCGGMVGRRIAKAAHDQRIIRQNAVFRRATFGGGDGIGGSDSFRQMAGDGGGLRRDVQAARSQHLVAATGDGVIG